jgi:hypothetical protein
MTHSHLGYLGRATAFHALGFSSEQIKVAFIGDGFTKEAAECLMKEAFWGKAIGLLTKGLVRGGKGLMGLAGKIPSPGMNPTVGKRIMNFAGNNMGRLGSQMTGAAQQIGQVGLPTALGRGAINAGKGFLGLKNAPGLGGTIGRAAGVAGTVGAIGSMASGGAQPPLQYGMQGQLPYGGMY